MSTDSIEISKDENLMYLGVSSKSEYMWIVDIKDIDNPEVLTKVNSA
jgi:hypothetical protein